ncbi:hypothetical protein [Halochromatium sp.]
MIEPDPSQLVDGDQGADKLRLSHQVIEHRRLAAAEEAGQQLQHRRYCAVAAGST